MRIGIDIDNCISNFDDTLLKEYLKHDKELRNTGIINKNPEYLRKGMFDWTEEEESSFYHANIEDFAIKLRPIEDSVYYIRKLKEDGHEIYIITGRNNGEYINPKELTTQWLDKYNIVYDKLIFTNAYDKHAKSLKCIEHNIDIMIDDFCDKCKSIANSKIKTIYLKDAPSFDIKENEYLKVLYNWGEIYRYINEIEKDK